MFEVVNSNLYNKFVDKAASEKNIVFECSLHRCVLLKGSLYGYGQVRHRGGNVQWIYSILLDVQISSSFDTDRGEGM